MSNINCEWCGRWVPVHQGYVSEHRMLDRYGAICMSSGTYVQKGANFDSLNAV